MVYLVWGTRLRKNFGVLSYFHGDLEQHLYVPKISVNDAQVGACNIC